MKKVFLFLKHEYEARKALETVSPASVLDRMTLAALFVSLWFLAAILPDDDDILNFMIFALSFGGLAAILAAVNWF